MGIQIKGIKGNYYSITPETKVNCMLTEVEDDNNAYGCDFVVRDKAHGQYVISARVSNKFFQKWHKCDTNTTVAKKGKAKLNKIVNDAVLQYYIDSKKHA